MYSLQMKTNIELLFCNNSLYHVWRKKSCTYDPKTSIKRAKRWEHHDVGLHLCSWNWEITHHWMKCEWSDLLGGDFNLTGHENKSGESIDVSTRQQLSAKITRRLFIVWSIFWPEWYSKLWRMVKFWVIYKSMSCWLTGDDLPWGMDQNWATTVQKMNYLNILDISKLPTTTLHQSINVKLC